MAHHAHVKQYYHARAAEYDEWYLGLGRFAGVLRPDWDRDVQALERAIARLPPVRTVDVACGTGYLSRHLRAQLTALDQSGRMLALAGERLPAARMIQSWWSSILRAALITPMRNGNSAC